MMRVQRIPILLQINPVKNPPTVIAPKVTALTALDNSGVSSPPACNMEKPLLSLDSDNNNTQIR